ncbi:putative metal-binding motif-containing protein [Corallococcus interemptor]|uniref:putative metal-binding motif-containing protein n=1 Tax=Corallococcus interemptor TaxID=2316720 RepID=UPI0035D493CF
MYRLCLLGCVVFLAACGEKAPDEGAIRVSVKYGSFKPACVRVEAKDASGHQGATDIPSSQFKNAEKNEVLVAVRRKADWDMALSVTASSYASATATGCDGPFVEQHSSNGPLTIVARKFTNFDVTLKATDADGDGHLAGAMWSEPADCDDSNPARHPGAVETCGSTVDLNCNERTGCQEENCWGNPCDDGNACTTGDRCEGSGLEAKCVPTQTTTCTQPTGVCDARLACNPASGLCEAAESTVGKSCNDGNACTDGDQCGADGKCGGTARTCTTSEQCLARSGTCNPANGQCVFTQLPATTACQDPVACTTPDRCDGNGNCVGTPTTCTPPPCYRVKQQCTANTECEYEVDLNGTCTTSGGVPGVCSATAECSPFPYRPSNFDPNSIAAADIGELRTSGSVTFDTTSRTWSPPGQVPTRDSIKYVLLDQGAGNPQAVLIPVSALALNGTLTITGPNPVIFAVYGSATVAQSILATGTIDTPNAACGTSQGGAGTASGSTGGGGGGGGNGTPGADGGNAYNAQNRGAAGINRATGPEPLLGGCPGGNGGAGASGGRGGAGGGAIQLSVAQTLTLDKNLSTSGNGGAGGTTGGGGGGGSGGQVVLEAFQLNLTAAARITANGGGGAEGGTTTSNAGSAGANGNQSSGAPATGGTGNNATGGAGGAGGAGTTLPVRGTDGTRDGWGTEGGGGGGGGSVGYIHLRSVQPCALAVGHVISPPATTPCTQP